MVRKETRTPGKENSPKSSRLSGCGGLPGRTGGSEISGRREAVGRNGSKTTERGFPIRVGCDPDGQKG